MAEILKDVEFNSHLRLKGVFENLLDKTIEDKIAVLMMYCNL